MTIFKFEDAFIKYFKPFGKIIKSEIKWARNRPAGATRPSTVKAGDLWTNTDENQEYYFSGVTDYKAGTSRPAGLTDGDKWYSLKQTPSMIVKVVGDKDLAYVNGVRELTVDNKNDSGSVFNTDGERLTLKAKAGTTDEVFTDLNVYNDGSNAEWRLVGPNGTIGAIRIKSDGTIYSNNKRIVTEDYDPAVTTLEITDSNEISQYVETDADLGGTPTYNYLRVNVNRTGSTVSMN